MKQKWLAEREGFEPPVRLPVRRISSAVHSTTLPPLQASQITTRKIQSVETNFGVGHVRRSLRIVLGQQARRRQPAFRRLPQLGERYTATAGLRLARRAIGA